MTSAAVQTRRTLTVDVDRWRLRDAAGTIRSSAMFDVALDAPTGTPVPFGVVALAAGLANGQHWAANPVCAATAGTDYAEPVEQYHRRAGIHVSYGDALARIGQRLSIVTETDADGLISTLETGEGRVATVWQTWAPTPVSKEGIVASVVEPPAHAQLFTRVRVGRWVYISGELPAVHGNHVACTTAGLPAAVVPESLLIGIAERELYGGLGAPSGTLRLRSDVAVMSGDWGLLEQEGGRSLSLRTGRGVAVRVERS